MVSAGDVERFSYCAHNWWLAHQGHGDEGARDGVRAHQTMGLAARKAEKARRDVASGFAWSFRILAVAGSATFLTLEVVFLRANPYHLIFLTTALVLLSASAGLLTVAADAERRMRKVQKDAGLVPGELVADDLLGNGRLLEDPEWDLHGRPDQLLKTQDGLVPVEVKTGHTPRRPHKGHRLQLAAYLRLMEAEGHPAEYGLLNYPDGVFRIAWDDALKGELRAVLDRIEEAERTGIANRDHHHEARCRGCARRDVCTQAL